MPYFIFEGPDGTGKSTAIQSVKNLLEGNWPNTTACTQLPGATPLGKQIRALVKTPHLIDKEIKISPYVRQMLYATDYADYLDSFLKPNLDKNLTVLCDRCSAISAIVYGLAEGADVTKLQQLFGDLESPVADITFIFQCPAEETVSRMASERDPNDHFDSKPIEFKKLLHKSYDDIMKHTNPYFTKLSKKIIPVDATEDPAIVALRIYLAISQFCLDKKRADLISD
jgi:dTMP kinase